MFEPPLALEAGGSGVIDMALLSVSRHRAFRTPEWPSRLDPFAEKLPAWLTTELGKSRKKRQTMKQQ